MSFRDAIKQNLEKNLNESLENYFIGDSGFGVEQERELLRFADILRRMANKTIKLTGSTEQLQALAQAAEQLEQQMNPLVRRHTRPQPASASPTASRHR